VTVTTLGQPAYLAETLKRKLAPHAGYAVIRVIPRDEDERKCGVRWADHYELRVYYTVTTSATLLLLEEQLREVPGVYALTQVHSDPVNPRRNVFTNPEWPAKLGTLRRDRDDLRPQVLALIKDPGGGTGA
jgi:hypothetical protein